MRYFDPFSGARAVFEDRYDPEAAHALASGVWRASLAVAAVLVLSGAGYGIAALSEVSGVIDSARDAASARPKTGIDRAALDAAIAGIAARAERFEALKTATSSVSDPSR